MDKRYAIGLDYGTLSARAVLIDLTDGCELASLVYQYRSGVIENALPNGSPLPPDYALQNPQDYLDAAAYLLGNIWKNAEIPAEAVAAIGVDFTACTPLPLDQDMTPLCFSPQHRNNPHSWVKLWKHHGAGRQCDRINQIAGRRGENFFANYGCNSSSEWLFAKMCETFEEAPQVFADTYRFMESGDWIVGQMTGTYCASTCTAGFKGFWNERDGYPSEDFCEEVSKGFGAVRSKLVWDIRRVGTAAGSLCEAWVQKTGLSPATVVAVCMIDAHAAFPAAGMAEANTMLMSMGTSLCHILISRTEKQVAGISGVVKDGVLSGSYGYEAGQAAVGDIYDWFIKNQLPADYKRAASESGMDLHTYIYEKVGALQPGESGLIALDWWNGNRSTLYDTGLSGLILGLTLQTRPEEILRAIVEATAFGTKAIIDTFRGEGVPVEHLYACGGIAQKNPVVMQIFSDVLGMEIHVSGVEQTAAYGAALYGAMAAQIYPSFQRCIQTLARPAQTVYRPEEARHKTYETLYTKYRYLYNLFGSENPELMHSLRDLKTLSK